MGSVRLVGFLCAFGSIAALGVVVASCSPGAVEYATDGFVVCEETVDCYEGLHYFPGTRCLGGRCKCPVEGDVQCCPRGQATEDCNRNCWKVEDCDPCQIFEPGFDHLCVDGGSSGEGGSGTGGAGGGGTGGAGGSGGGAVAACKDVSDCPQSADARCGTATCEKGVCGIAYVEAGTPIMAQVKGDCQERVCGVDGLVVTREDPGDAYDDGKECTYDYCDSKGKVNASMDGVTCPKTGEGFCSAGECVECFAILGPALCKPGELCVYGRCVPMTCQNMAAPPEDGEPDIDCGGPCAPCKIGDKCFSGEDCLSKSCKGGVCVAPTCSDNAMNDGETDVDCGLACMQLCQDEKGCEEHEDCVSGVCWGGKCAAPTCEDGLKNGEEMGEDCGAGETCPACP